MRDRKNGRSVLDTFLQEFGLANDEGVALLCLAEGLLRIPDSQTADALIADKIATANWTEHLGDSESVFVNASTWGLLLTGKVIALEDARGPGEWLAWLVNRLGEPVIRVAMRQAIELLGREFVLGRTIEDAMARSQEAQFDNVSYDMLGEGARTRSDADRYFGLYQSAIKSVAPLGSGPAMSASASAAVGVSIKLSALQPRYCVTQVQRVDTELYPRLLTLCELAARHEVAIAIDAEEADRLDLSLELFERLARAESLADWQGLGIVVQAYGKRALPILDWLIELAGDRNARFRFVSSRVRIGMQRLNSPRSRATPTFRSSLANRIRMSLIWCALREYFKPGIHYSGSSRLTMRIRLQPSCIWARVANLNSSACMAWGNDCLLWQSRSTRSSRASGSMRR